jgi:hypothetical protein
MLKLHQQVRGVRTRRRGRQPLDESRLSRRRWPRVASMTLTGAALVECTRSVTNVLIVRVPRTWMAVRSSSERVKMNRKLWLGAVSILVAGAALVGCDSQSGSIGARTPSEDPSTSVVVVVSSESTASVRPTPSTSDDPASAPSTRTGVSATPSTPRASSAQASGASSVATTEQTASRPTNISSIDLPKDLTPDQRADADLAVAAYGGWVNFIDEAWEKPGAQWSAGAALWAAGAPKDQFLKGIAKAGEMGIHGAGRSKMSVRVTRVGRGVVSLSVCMDSSAVDVISAKGKSIKAPNQSGSYWRSPGVIEVLKVDSGNPLHEWLVSAAHFDMTKSC